jgi:hypothetical protein
MLYEEGGAEEAGPGRKRAQPPSMDLAMTMRWIWLVPS